MIIFITIICFFCSGVIYSQINSEHMNIIRRCPLSERISTEIKNNNEVINERNVSIRMRKADTKEILTDLIIYSEMFLEWARRWELRNCSSNETHDEAVRGTNVPSKKEIESQIELEKQQWYYGTKEISRYGGIMALAMYELGVRRETNAVPYLVKILEIKLPPELPSIISSRVERTYKLPAAVALIMMEMPIMEKAEDKIRWLNNFVEYEKNTKNRKWVIKGCQKIIKMIEDGKEVVFSDEPF